MLKKVHCHSIIPRFSKTPLHLHHLRWQESDVDSFGWYYVNNRRIWRSKQAPKEGVGGATSALAPPSPYPQQAPEVHFFVDQWFKTNWFF